MFNADAKLLARLARNLNRVVIVDPNAASTYLLSDMLRGLGAKRCAQASSTDRGFELCAESHPQVLFCEFSGPDLDGPALTSRLRRSSLAARTAPVIMVSWDTREHAIRLSRDSGAHEYLGKPFSAAGVFRRLENVLLKPRPWVESEIYVGPDRRRFNSGALVGRGRRGTDQAVEAASAEETFLSAEGEILAALSRSDEEPKGALGRMMEQTFRLQRAARQGREEELDDAIEALQRYLMAGIEVERLDAPTVVAHLNRIGALRHVAVSRAAQAAEPASGSVTLF